MIYGLPDETFLAYYAELTSGAPRELPKLVAVLSAPDETYSTSLPPLVTSTVDNFKFVYNSTTGITEALLLLKSIRSTDSPERAKIFGVYNEDHDFTPYILFGIDPMQSATTRTFFSSIGNSLVGHDITLRILATDSNPLYNSGIKDI